MAYKPNVLQQCQTAESQEKAEKDSFKLSRQAPMLTRAQHVPTTARCWMGGRRNAERAAASVCVPRPGLHHPVTHKGYYVLTI